MNLTESKHAALDPTEVAVLSCYRATGDSQCLKMAENKDCEEDRVSHLQQRVGGIPEHTQIQVWHEHLMIQFKTIHLGGGS